MITKVEVANLSSMLELSKNCLPFVVDTKVCFLYVQPCRFIYLRFINSDIMDLISHNLPCKVIIVINRKVKFNM